MLKNTLLGLALLACLTNLNAVGQSVAAAHKKVATPAQAPKDIVHTLGVNAQFASLIKAIKAADFTNALSQAGPFTVFAPTDEAFSQITFMNDLMEPTNKEKLASVLKYHVVQGKLMASELRDGQTLVSLTGEELAVSVMNGKVMINGTEITQPNLVAANGVIHVINHVMLPGANLGNK